MWQLENTPRRVMMTPDTFPNSKKSTPRSSNQGLPLSATVFQPKGPPPTAEQRAIQLERHRHVVVEANAGAAKTTTLALRLAQALARGANLEHIQTLTYTDAAVASLRLALDRIGIPAAVRNRLRIQTFDQFCAERLATLEGPGVTRYTAP